MSHPNILFNMLLVFVHWRRAQRLVRWLRGDMCCTATVSHVTWTVTVTVTVTVIVVTCHRPTGLYTVVADKTAIRRP
jgi:hypothetical protein